MEICARRGLEFEERKLKRDDALAATQILCSLKNVMAPASCTRCLDSVVVAGSSLAFLFSFFFQPNVQYRCLSHLILSL
jgi:hypothetical protein